MSRKTQLMEKVLTDKMVGDERVLGLRSMARDLDVEGWKTLKKEPLAAWIVVHEVCRAMITPKFAGEVKIKDVLYGIQTQIQDDIDEQVLVDFIENAKAEAMAQAKADMRRIANAQIRVHHFEKGADRSAKEIAVTQGIYGRWREHLLTEAVKERFAELAEIGRKLKAEEDARKSAKEEKKAENDQRWREIMGRRPAIFIVPDDFHGAIVPVVPMTLEEACMVTMKRFKAREGDTVFALIDDEKVVKASVLQLDGPNRQKRIQIDPDFGWHEATPEEKQARRELKALKKRARKIREEMEDAGTPRHEIPRMRELIDQLWEADNASEDVRAARDEQPGETGEARASETPAKSAKTGRYDELDGAQLVMVDGALTVANRKILRGEADEARQRRELEAVNAPKGGVVAFVTYGGKIIQAWRRSDEGFERVRAKKAGKTAKAKGSESAWKFYDSLRRAS